jgi:endonuclease/exonuclease/phosphatase family metal-dependent hydrolase
MRTLPTTLSKKRPLRVLTMNIWNFAPPYAERQKLLRDGIRRLDPDLMAFQEAGYDGKQHQVGEFLDGLGYQVVHQFDLVPFPGCIEGCCIASRWPMEIIELCSLRFTKRSKSYPYVAMVARVRVPAPVGPMLFVCAKPSWELNAEYERELQAVALAKLVKKHADRKGFPPVFAGDFDATPDSASIRFLTGKQSLQGISVHYLDCWQQAGDGSEGYTWTCENPGVRENIERWRMERHHARRIDYIFLGSHHDYNRYARVRRCRVVLNNPTHGVWPSDHYAVYAEIEVVK